MAYDDLNTSLDLFDYDKFEQDLRKVQFDLDNVEKLGEESLFMDPVSTSTLENKTDIRIDPFPDAEAEFKEAGVIPIGIPIVTNNNPKSNETGDTPPPKYTVKEFANKIRKTPRFIGQFDTIDDSTLVDHWINENPETRKFLTKGDYFGVSLDPPKFRSKWDKPKDASGEIGKMLFNIKSGAYKFPSFITGNIATLVNPDNTVNSIKRKIDEYSKIAEQKLEEGDLKNYKKYTEIYLPNLHNRLKQYDELRDSESGQWKKDFYDDMVNVSEITYHWSQDKIRNMVENDPAIQARINWEINSQPQSWRDYLHRDMMIRFTTDLASSMATMAIGGGTAALPFKIARLGFKAKKAMTWADRMKRLSTYSTIGGQMETMFLLEGGETYYESLDYLLNEYQYVNPDGKVITGLPFEDAFTPAVLTANTYAFGSSFLEWGQMFTLGKYFKGAAKGIKGAFIKKASDRFVADLPKSFNSNGYLRIAGTAGLNVSKSMFFNANIEGYQASGEYLSNKALRNGFDIDTPFGLNNLLNQMGLEANKIGFSNIAIPWMSDVPEIKYQSRVGGLGFFIPSASYNSMAVLNKWRKIKRDGSNGANIEVKADGSLITYTNTDTGESTLVDAGDENAASTIVNNDKSDVTEEGGNLTVIDKIETSQQYAQKVADIVDSKVSIVDVLDDIQASWKAFGYTEEQIKRDPLLSLIQKTATSRKAPTIGKIASDIVKVSSDPKIFRKTNADEVTIKTLETLASKEIKRITENKVVNAAKKEPNKDIVKAVVGGALNDKTVYPDERVLAEYAAETIENNVVDVLNKDPEIDIDFEMAKIADEGIMKQGHVAGFVDAQEEEKAEKAAVKESIEDIIASSEIEVNRRPIKNFNGKDVDSKRLMAHFLYNYDRDRSRSSNLSTMANVIQGTDASSRINNTNLGKLARALNVPFKNLEAERTTVVNSIVNKLADYIDPVVTKPIFKTKKPAVRVKTPVSRAEQVEGVGKIPVEKKAPAKATSKDVHKAAEEAGMKWDDDVEIKEVGTAMGWKRIDDMTPSEKADLISEIEKKAPFKKIEKPGKLRKVISGAQVGADQLGLRVAKEGGYETGGTAPPGWATSKGSQKDLMKSYGLVEGEVDPKTYPKRTRKNVEDSDGTVLFGNINSPGSKLTLGHAKRTKKPYIANPTASALKQWIIDNDIEVLNIAGNRNIDENKVLPILREALGITSPAEIKGGPQEEYEAPAEEVTDEAILEALGKDTISAEDYKAAIQGKEGQAKETKVEDNAKDTNNKMEDDIIC